MVYKINKFFFKIVTSFKLILINILFISIIFLYAESAFSKISDIEQNLAHKYCDSIERNLFKGLDNEIVLKYEYFFNSINAEAKNEEIESFNDLVSVIQNTCSYKLKAEEREEFIELLERFFLSAKK